MLELKKFANDNKKAYSEHEANRKELNNQIRSIENIKFKTIFC